ncbi:class I SAM-dependent methyltransferase [Rhodococcus qingshengii]|uniref:class I SAM-dependent methyltransferase n=1 Tax=Rhodococcus TaxID=1827 RepID=UPI001BB051CD|nr:class I SAM-dependent methyltransferase [Rhodococcus qingshengii]MBS3695700.1 class I SAM-dependent methyltransferase [Rhodococcus qingshengii]
MDTTEIDDGLWGVRADDWAHIQQRTITPASIAVLDELQMHHGEAILDIGCGEGTFSALTRERGAVAAGIDACVPLIAIARRHTPDGDFRVGDMEHLPFPDHTFHAVTAFNSLHFAHNPAQAIREAIRVLRPGGRLVLATWGPPDECDAITYLVDLGALMPPDSSLTAIGIDATDLDALGATVAAAGLHRSPTRVIPCPWEYCDLDTALRGLLSTGPAARAIEHCGLAHVQETITESIAPYRRDDGSYILDNTCHYLIAQHPHR